MRRRRGNIAEDHRPAVFSKNADVLPTFLVDGFVAGTWELSRNDGEARIELRPFESIPRAIRDSLSDEAETPRKAA